MSKSDDMFWLRQLRDLERYCNKEGYRVIYKDVEIDTIYYDKQLFVMSDRLNDEISLYHLLHELGHVRVLQKDKSYNEVYSYIYDNFSYTSLTRRIANIQEELDAWKEGLKLARKLGLHIDRRKWEITKTKCISTYLSWAIANRDRKTKRKSFDGKGT